MLDLSLFQELYNQGLFALPIIWDTQNKQATAHPEHDINSVTMSLQYVEALLQNGFNKSNGIALKLVPPFGMVDFDLKNTDNKNVYNDWLAHVTSINENILRKVVIETTRSGGYHVYIKYAKLSTKLPIAKSKEGTEVISLYTGALLSYTYPTPGYKIIYNDFNDLDFLTDEEYDLIVSAASIFNEYEDHTPGENIKPVEYPVEYESLLLQFDQKCTDHVFEVILNSIDLFPVTNTKQFERKKYAAYLRKGSTAAYSAKVFFKNKRLLIFSASMPKFPTWHDTERQGSTNWILTPSKILYFKHNKNWIATIEEINGICESVGIEIEVNTSITNLPLVNNNRLNFPYDIFPDTILNFIRPQVIQHEYIAGCVLAALSTCIGNSVDLMASDGYRVKPVLYMAIVAPPGASKSPALKKAFAPLELFDSNLYKQHQDRLKDFKQKLAESKKDKSTEPDKPAMHQTLIKDSTIEMVVKILSFNSLGCCVVADELSGFLARMTQYKDGDDTQKWLEMWSGAPVMIQRITRDETKVEDPYCSIIGGIQPGVLEKMSREDNQFNGFYHRFLFVYPEPQQKINWQPLTIPDAVKFDYSCLFNTLLKKRIEDKYTYYLSGSAEALYKQWHDNKNIKYNRATSDNVKGIIAKYQDYCLRFAILLQVIHDNQYRTGIVSIENMERAIRLTEYFLGNMHKALKVLNPETPADKLQDPYDKLYAALPVTFSMKAAIETGETIGIKANTVKTFIHRGGKELLKQVERGIFEKLY